MANGDAADWMQHDKGIITFSVELSADDEHGENTMEFYIEKKYILKVIEQCLVPI